MRCLCRTHQTHLSGSWLRHVRSCARAGIGLLLFFGAQACHKASPPPPVTTVTVIDQGWTNTDYQDRLNEVAEFTRQTGIRVEFLPGPESAADQVATWRKLLQSGGKVPDVYVIDVIWPGVLADYLLDLKPYVPQQEIAPH